MVLVLLKYQTKYKTQKLFLCCFFVHFLCSIISARHIISMKRVDHVSRMHMCQACIWTLFIHVNICNSWKYFCIQDLRDRSISQQVEGHHGSLPTWSTHNDGHPDIAEDIPQQRRSINRNKGWVITTVCNFPRQT